jgi:SAM-dependent methyltransferase
VTRPDNPFAAAGAGAQYHQGRPYHHPRSIARIFAMLGVETASRALDVACGTGMSTVALADRVEGVVGVDRSPDMLAFAPRTDRVSYAFSTAEALPFADASFDGITTCSGVHWFDQPRFFAECRRLLRGSGWIALYDHYFLGEMVDVPEFAAWTRELFKTYPLPPRTPQVGDPRSELPAGFTKVGDEFFADDIEMTHDGFVDYILSISNLVAAVERGATRDQLRAELRSTTAPFFSGTEPSVVRFLGSITCLRVA